MPHPLSVDEEEVVGLLEQGGLPRAAARCLACLLRGGTWTRADVAAVAGLLPQDVSGGMRFLENRALVRIDGVPRTGAGRPLLQYVLAHGAGETLSRIVAARRDAIRSEMEALGRLEERARRRAG